MFSGSLFLSKVLDREERDVYQFTVVAKNTAPPYHTAKQHVKVIVDDENDEKPVFTKNEYQVTYIISVFYKLFLIITCIDIYKSDAECHIVLSFYKHAIVGTPPFWTRHSLRRGLCNQLRLSVRPSVRLQHKISYFPPLDFSDFLHQVSLL